MIDAETIKALKTRAYKEYVRERDRIYEQLRDLEMRHKARLELLDSLGLRERPGPEPERLEIDMSWEEAVGVAILSSACHHSAEDEK